MLEDGRTVALHVFAKPDAVGCMCEQATERGLACLNWLAAQTFAVELDEVESVEEGGLLALWPVPQQLEIGEPVIVTNHHFTVDQTGPAPQDEQRSGDRRIAVRPIVVASGLS